MFWLKKLHFQMFFAKWLLFCLTPNGLKSPLKFIYDGLAQDCNNSSVLENGVLQSWTKL